jgi:predicted metal-dependent hydrolase
MRVNRKDQSIHVYVNKHLPINMIDDFIKKHIIKQYRHLQKSTTNKRIDINHLYLLNEKYSLQIIPITTKRKYEIYQNKIYLQCKKTTDKIILVKQLLLDYCERFIRPLFLK